MAELNTTIWKGLNDCVVDLCATENKITSTDSQLTLTRPEQQFQFLLKYERHFFDLQLFVMRYEEQDKMLVHDLKYHGI